MFKFWKGKKMASVPIGFNVTPIYDSPDKGPFRIVTETWSSDTGLGGEIKGRFQGVYRSFCVPASVRVFVGMMNDAYRLGMEDEKREREKKYIGSPAYLDLSKAYNEHRFKPTHKFKKGDRVKMGNCGAATVVGPDPLNEWKTCILPDFGSMNHYWPTDGLTLITATISRKFIGGPLDGLSFTLDGWTKQTKYAGELHMGSGGAIDFLKTDCGHTYKLGTVNGEQMMVYERGSK